MSLQGKILLVESNRAKVLVKPVANCNGCKACAGLIKASNAAQSEQVIDAFTNNLPVNKDNIVKLELKEGTGSLAALILYGIPMISFISGMLLAPYICEMLGLQSTDIMRALFAFIFLFLSFYVVYKIWGNKNKPSNLIMTITEIIS